MTDAKSRESLHGALINAIDDIKKLEAVIQDIFFYIEIRGVRRDLLLLQGHIDELLDRIDLTIETLKEE